MIDKMQSDKTIRGVGTGRIDKVATSSPTKPRVVDKLLIGQTINNN